MHPNEARIRFSSKSLIPFVRKAVQHGSELRTDSWRAYNELRGLCYIHEKINVAASYDPAHVFMPGVHGVSSLLKRWLLGTHQGAVSEKHLDYYFDE